MPHSTFVLIYGRLVNVIFPFIKPEHGFTEAPLKIWNGNEKKKSISLLNPWVTHTHTYSKHTDLPCTTAFTFPARLYRGLFFLPSIATKMTFGSEQISNVMFGSGL